jgi:hypothetical protein
MGFFDRLLRKKHDPSPNPVRSAVDELSAYCADVARLSPDLGFAPLSFESQVLSIYAFGGVHVSASKRRFDLATAHAVCLALFSRHFQFTAEDAAAKAHALIAAASDQTAYLHPVIHRGIDGFLAWQEGKREATVTDFRDVLAIMKKNSEKDA